MALTVSAAPPVARIAAIESAEVIGAFMGFTVRRPHPSRVQGISKFRPRIGDSGIQGADAAFSGQTESVKVLLVEDDQAIAESVRSGLESLDFQVEVVGTGELALESDGFDVMLLDVGLPGIDGFEVCRRFRTRSSVPIIMLTARADEIDKVVGLESGADDYVAKPFGLRELAARIRAVTRRVQHVSATPQRLEVGPLVIDCATRRCFLEDQEIQLTAKEFDLLSHLMGAPGVVHRRREILESVWDTDWYGPTKTLDAHIASLRKKLGRPEWIESVRGVGFRLDIE